jgi:hypothetical protein
MLRHPAVVDQSILPGGFLVAGNEGDVADLDPFGSREEGHGEWVALYGGHHGAPVEQHAGQPGLRGRDPGREATGTCSNYKYVRLVHRCTLTA